MHLNDSRGTGSVPYPENGTAGPVRRLTRRLAAGERHHLLRGRLRRARLACRASGSCRGAARRRRPRHSASSRTLQRIWAALRLQPHWVRSLIVDFQAVINLLSGGAQCRPPALRLDSQPHPRQAGACECVGALARRPRAPALIHALADGDDSAFSDRRAINLQLRKSVCPTTARASRMRFGRGHAH
jgi:hypothetical protein